MCIACREFIKETLSLKEFKAALWEVTRDDEEHLNEIDKVIQQHPWDVTRMREKLRTLLAGTSDPKHRG